MDKRKPLKKKTQPLESQVGGSHYKLCRIQPVEFIHANDLGFCEGNVVKYVTRHKSKGRADDIRKAIHFLELILYLEYGQNAANQKATYQEKTVNTKS